MQRGYLREEISASSSLKIDIQYYLHQQILPVISRLLEPFDGTDQAYLAQCLGLDSSKYKHRQKNYATKDNENQCDDENDQEFHWGENIEDFKQCDPFVFPCVQCETLNFWNAPFVFNEVTHLFPRGLRMKKGWFRRIKHAHHHFFVVQMPIVLVSQLIRWFI